MKSSNSISMSLRGLAMLAAMQLTACNTTAPYVPPTLDAKSLTALPSAKSNETLQNGVPSALWWNQIGDAQLDTLIQLAWQNNYDLRAALARVTFAQEQVQVAKAANWPDATLEASESRRRFSAVESKTPFPGVYTPTEWQASFSWELDLFGRIRHTIDAAQASADEQTAMLDDVRRLILASVIDAYLDLRGAQMLSICIRQQLDNQAATLKLVRDRESAGRAAPEERMRFEAQVSLAESRLPSLVAHERAARNRLATLTGLRLDSPQLALLDRPVELKLPQALITDEPATILLRRPDVRVAERALAVAAAREGIAEADLFPRITLAALLGSYGVAGEWLEGEGNRWLVGGSVSYPLFDGGARRARVRAADAEVDVSRANFDKVVAIALEETDTAISNWVQLKKRNSELNIAHELAQESARLARIRYQEGAESLLDVLESERIALETEEQLVAAKRDWALSTARCYVAMAGGFDGPKT
jgi:NodT family efflux transporter outer membrane factor (OMF) lipoprotein